MIKVKSELQFILSINNASPILIQNVTFNQIAF